MITDTFSILDQAKQKGDIMELQEIISCLLGRPPKLGKRLGVGLEGTRSVSRQYLLSGCAS